MEKYVLNGQGYIKLVDWMGDDNRIIQAFKKSTDTSKNIDVESFLKARWEEEHYSPFEHVVFTFYIECPIVVARQWMRHRTGSYNELSRRYTSKNVSFYMPPVLYNNGGMVHPMNDYFLNKIDEIYKEIYKLYYEMINADVSKEQARFILPVSTNTSFYFTMNLRNLIHFLQLRDSKHAQAEIVEYAKAIKELIKPIIPITYKVVFVEG